MIRSNVDKPVARFTGKITRWPVIIVWEVWTSYYTKVETANIWATICKTKKNKYKSLNNLKRCTILVYSTPSYSEGVEKNAIFLKLKMYPWKSWHWIRIEIEIKKCLTSENGFGHFESVASLKSAINEFRVRVKNNFETESTEIRFHWTRWRHPTKPTYQFFRGVAIHVVNFEPVVLAQFSPVE